MLRFLFSLTFLFLLSTSVHAQEALNTKQQDEVRQLVRDTLLKNPEIIVEAMQILQERQDQAQREHQQKVLSSLKEQIIKGPMTPVFGNPKGDVTLVEFFDYQCGYCKRAFPGVMEVVESDKNLRFVLKEFAILSPVSEVAAKAALASQNQGKYMEFHKKMMSLRGALTEDKIMKTAESVGLDTVQLKKDMQSEKVSAEISSTREMARNLGINGTPGFIIGDQVIPGAVSPDALKEAIAKARQK